MPQPTSGLPVCEAIEAAARLPMQKLGIGVCNHLLEEGAGLVRERQRHQRMGTGE